MVHERRYNLFFVVSVLLLVNGDGDGDGDGEQGVKNAYYIPQSLYLAPQAWDCSSSQALSIPANHS